MPFDISHEVGHKIYTRMDHAYQVVFEEIYQYMRAVFVRSVMRGHSPKRVATAMHSYETFLTDVNKLPGCVCWPGVVGKVDTPWDSDYKEQFHKQNVMHITNAYTLLDDSEEAFCEFFARYHEFDRESRELRPKQDYKNRVLKEFGDSHMASIIGSAAKEARDSRKEGIRAWLRYAQKK